MYVLIISKIALEFQTSLVRQLMVMVSANIRIRKQQIFELIRFDRFWKYCAGITNDMEKRYLRKLLTVSE